MRIEKAVVDYVSLDQEWNELAAAIHAEGYFCNLTSPNPDTLIGGSSPDFSVLDLGPGSAAHARMILRLTPKLFGRVVAVGPAPGCEQIDGVIISERAGVARKVDELFSCLGKRIGDA